MIRSLLENTDNELLKMMLAGRDEALAALYHRHSTGVFRFALQMSGTRQTAEDVTQEVFMVLMRDGAGYDLSRGSLIAFLLGITRNLVRQRSSREQIYVAVDEESPNGFVDRPFEGASVLDEMTRDETIGVIRRAVLSLPERYREVVVLCDLQELSYVDAAAVLGCAVGTVRSRLHRARSLLLDKLRPAQVAESAAPVRSARCLA